MPQIPQYDGTTDPVDHLDTFRTTMLLYGASDGFLCRALPTTLTGAARDWYSRLKPSSVDNFADFGDDLARHFMSSRRPRKTTASLMALRQGDDEALKVFVGRFNREALQVPNLDPSAAMNALLAGARSTDFRRALARRNPQSLADLMAGAEEDQIPASREARIRPRYGGQKVKAVFLGAYDQGLDGTAPQADPPPSRHFRPTCEVGRRAQRV
ncbi:uncharacterized protein LOC143870009 [Tasmannia lanceolata]|uniref:uncharacterized protein LOC143870009 n=1 Tax=Tasmannia lanceolata TaxID=3420 RepID=UPI004063B4DA